LRPANAELQRGHVTADDVFNPTVNATLLSGRIPNATVEIIPKARHAYFEEFREIASPLVRDFLTTTP
jgi:3-oxoadipate enol-lactonase